MVPAKATWDLVAFSVFSLFLSVSAFLSPSISVSVSLSLCLSLCLCPLCLFCAHLPFSARLGNRVTYIPIVKTSGLTNKCLFFLLGREASFASCPANNIMLRVSVVGSLCSEEQAAMATQGLAAVASGACGELSLP